MVRILLENSVVWAWVIFSLASPVAYALLLFWSVKNHQFDHPERGGALPLESCLPEVGDEGEPASEEDNDHV